MLSFKSPITAPQSIMPDSWPIPNCTPSATMKISLSILWLAKKTRLQLKVMLLPNSATSEAYWTVSILLTSWPRLDMATQLSVRGSKGMSASFSMPSLPNFFPTKAPFSDRSSLALIPLHQSGSKWCITPDRAVQLDGAHGSEIVRSICFPNYVSFCSYYLLSHPALFQARTCKTPLDPLSLGPPEREWRKMTNSNIFTSFKLNIYSL